jgi:hypothetical protein
MEELSLPTTLCLRDSAVAQKTVPISSDILPIMHALFVPSLFLGLMAVVPALAGTVCTDANIVVRKEWYSMLRSGGLYAGYDMCAIGSNIPASERIDYINTVKCVTKIKTIYSGAEIPGARTHIDNFTATHINYTWAVHDSSEKALAPYGCQRLCD